MIWIKTSGRTARSEVQAGAYAAEWGVMPVVDLIAVFETAAAAASADRELAARFRGEAATHISAQVHPR